MQSDILCNVLCEVLCEVLCKVKTWMLCALNEAPPETPIAWATSEVE